MLLDKVHDTENELSSSKFFTIVKPLIFGSRMVKIFGKNAIISKSKVFFFFRNGSIIFAHILKKCFDIHQHRILRNDFHGQKFENIFHCPVLFHCWKFPGYFGIRRKIIRLFKYCLCCFRHGKEFS